MGRRISPNTIIKLRSTLGAVRERARVRINRLQILARRLQRDLRFEKSYTKLLETRIKKLNKDAKAAAKKVAKGK